MQPSATRRKRGVIAGLLGGSTMALWYFLLDLASGRPFATPAALGSSLLFAKSTLEVSARVVVAYAAFHFAAFVFAGLVFVWLAEKMERKPSFLLVALLFLILLEALALVNLASYAQWGLGSLGVWSVSVGNVLAVAVMAWYVWVTHPRLRDLGDRPPPSSAVRV